MSAMADDDYFVSSSRRSNLGSGGSSSSSSSTKCVIKPWSKLNKRSKSSSSSPWLSPLRQRQLIQPVPSTAPPFIWDVEFPRSSSPSSQQRHLRSKRESVKLRRSLSLLERPTPPPPPPCSVRRSLWSKESKEALQMRLGVYLDAMPEESSITSCSSREEQASLEKKQPDETTAVMISKQQQQQQQSPDRSGEDTSSIFSSKKSLSFSSGSDGCSSSALARQDEEQDREEVEEQGEFLDYTLVRGHLVLPETTTVASDDHDHRGRRRHCDESKHRVQERRPAPSRSPPFGQLPSSRSLRKNKAMDEGGDDGGNRNRLVARRLQFTSTPGPRSKPSGGSDLLRNLLDAFPRALIRKRTSSSSSGSSGDDSCSSSFRAAHLHCAIKHDHYSYTYIVDGSDERIVAKAPRNRQNRYDREDEHKEGDEEGEEEEVCSFYSWRRGSGRAHKARSSSPWWFSPIFSGDSSSRTRDSSEMVASMRLRVRSSRSGLEFQFVLADHSREVDPAMITDHRLSFSSWQNGSSSSASILSKSSGLTRMRKSLSQNSSPIRGKIADDHGEELDILRDVWKQMEADRAAAARRRKKTIHPLQELAAVVVKVSLTKDLFTSSSKNFQHSRNASVEFSPDDRFAAMSVTAILPVSEHGMPDHRPEGDESDRSGDLDRLDGPSSLIERWRRRRCDCGGWDLGCAIHTLERNPDATNQSSSKLLNISLEIQGGRGQIDRACFSLTGLSNGLFSVRFKAPMSALQALATAVAILHSTRVNIGQDPQMSPWSKASTTTDAHLERL